jgi:hypothetical protein
VTPDAALVARVDAAVRGRNPVESGAEVRFTCPNSSGHRNGDAHPSCRWNAAKAVYHCDSCGSGGGVLELAGLLGVPRTEHQGAPAACARATTTTVYEIRGLDGSLVAEHVRRDFADGTKRFSWRREGKYSLGGVKKADLPLYGSERLRDLADGKVLVVAEGEKAADALHRRGIAAVGTVTGAPSAPASDVLRALLRFDVVLWPDNDAVGEEQMRTIAERLLRLGLAKIRVLRWSEAPPKGDAFDFFEKGGTTEGANALVAASIPAAVATAAAPDDYVFVPGEHIDDEHHRHEVGVDDFVAAVIKRLPPGALYRMDAIIGELSGEPGARRFTLVTEQHLRAVVDEHVKLAKWIDSDFGPIRRFVACGRDHASIVLAAAGISPRVRELTLLVRHPVYLPGLVLARSGWNENGGVFYDEPESLKNLAPRPATARAVLEDLVVDFPFADEASRQNTFGAMLTNLLRPAIEGCVPFHLVMAPLERTGKGKLIDAAVGAAVLGRPVAPMQPGRTEEEREKRVTALLLAGESVVHIDNLPVGEVFDSAALASLATSWPRWRGRILGVSKTPLLPNNLVVFLSGNNVKATGEIVKRSVPIVLQPKDDHPEDRDDFQHKDALNYAGTRRRGVAEALIGMIETWKTAGRPPAKHGRTMGGFELWAALVGGVLGHAGFVEWHANYRAWVRAADEFGCDAEALVELWMHDYGVGTIRAAHVVEMIERLEIFPGVLVKPTTAARAIAVGRHVLTPLLKRPVGKWQVTIEGKGGSKGYALRAYMPVASGGSATRTSSEGSEGSEGSPTPPHAGEKSNNPSSASVDAGQKPSDPSEASDGEPRREARTAEPRSDSRTPLPPDARTRFLTGIADEQKSENICFDFEERAGVRQFDGGESREEAEAGARAEIVGSAAR